jgi:hypothetical protein
VQCRIFHIGNAAQDAIRANLQGVANHCEHAAGRVSFCLP